MKRYPFLIFFFLIMLLLSFTTLSHAILNSDVKKAKEFMTAGMYPQAIELLNKRIYDKPTDAEAHFQVGICYINTGNYEKANERFGSAVRLEPDYGYRIGGEYKKAGVEFLNSGETEKSLKIFRNAVRYQPDLNKDIAQMCYLAGKASLDKNRIAQAQSLFKDAAEYQPALEKDVALQYFSAAKKVLNHRQSNVADKLFVMAVHYDSSLSQEIADYCASLNTLDGYKLAVRYNQEKYNKALAEKQYETVRAEFEEKTGLKLKPAKLFGSHEELILTENQKGCTVYVFSKHDFAMVDKSKFPSRGSASTRGVNPIKFRDFKGFVKFKKLNNDVTVYYAVERAKQN